MNDKLVVKGQVPLDEEIGLTSISPVAYMVASDGDLGEIKRTKPHVNEYREKIGAPTEAFLVFKGRTKIGMIPRFVVARLGAESIGRRCRIIRMDRAEGVITVRLLRRRLTQ